MTSYPTTVTPDMTPPHHRANTGRCNSLRDDRTRAREKQTDCVSQFPHSVMMAVRVCVSCRSERMFESIVVSAQAERSSTYILYWCQELEWKKDMVCMIMKDSMHSSSNLEYLSLIHI